MTSAAFDRLQAVLTTRQPVKVSKSDYYGWKNEYVFDALKNQRYGQSFCTKFNIADNVLSLLTNTVWADEYIRSVYVN